MQSGGTRPQSNMIRFQSSPVDNANKRRKALKKLLKFLRSSSTSPSVTSPNMNTPRIENIKKISMSSMVTLRIEGMEKRMV